VPRRFRRSSARRTPSPDFAISRGPSMDKEIDFKAYPTCLTVEDWHDHSRFVDEKRAKRYSSEPYLESGMDAQNMEATCDKLVLLLTKNPGHAIWHGKVEVLTSMINRGSWMSLD
jgi:hypothetical protein